MLKGLRMHPVGTLCCYLTGIALRRTFLWRVIQAGGWRKVGQILRSSWVNGQLSREQDKEGPGIERLWFWITYRTWKPCKVGVDWSFSCTCLINSKSQVSWRFYGIGYLRSALLYTLESCENCGLKLRLEWENTWFVHIARMSQPCNYQQELGFLFNVRTTPKTWDIALMEFMLLTYFERDKKGKVEAEEHSNDICWSQITRHCQTIWWIIPQYSSRLQTQGCGLWGWRELNARRNQQNKNLMGLSRGRGMFSIWRLGSRRWGLVTTLNIMIWFGILTAK